jgi:hypothetical protein
MSIEAMKQALEDLVKEEIRYYHDGHYIDSSDAKYQLLSFAHRVAKATINTNPQPKRECDMGVMCIECPDAQPKRELIGLTDDEVEELWERTGDYGSFYLAVEAKLRDKNL